jgi:putative sigma-54 modulation protein
MRRRFAISSSKGDEFMKITINGKKTEVPERLRPIIERKLLKFEKYFKDDVEAAVVLRSKNNMETVEVTFVSGGTIYRAEQSDKTYQNALDSVVYVIERKIRKNKTRLERKLREGVFVKGSDSFVPTEIDVTDEEEFNVRIKSFKFKPMSVEEAILQMNLLQHSFYVFINDKTEEVNVVYVKEDGNYGCIVPE